MSLLKILDFNGSFLQAAAHEAFIEELSRHIKSKLAGLDELSGLPSNKHDIERLIHSVETHKMRCLKGEISAKRLYTDVDSALRLFRMKHPKFDLQRDPIMVAYYS